MHYSMQGAGASITPHCRLLLLLLRFMQSAATGDIASSWLAAQGCAAT
jgi:hypothetical protein